MSNKARNAEAVHIHRALITGQATSVVEAWANAMVKIIFGVDLSHPMNQAAMWRPRR
jgi:hypothetical protein